MLLKVYNLKLTGVLVVDVLKVMKFNLLNAIEGWIFFERVIESRVFCVRA